MRSPRRSGVTMLARKREHPGDDVISRLCATPGTSDDEIAMLSMFLLFAEHETTVTALGTGTLLLLTQSASGALAADPALVPQAVEEMLRAGGQGGGGILRYVRTGLRVGEVTIRPGDLVLLDNGAANHDRTVFTDPERVEVTRSPVAHLSFGHGARYCLGAPLARIELQVVFSMLVPRFPALRLSEPAGRLTFTVTP